MNSATRIDYEREIFLCDELGIDWTWEDINDNDWELLDYLFSDSADDFFGDDFDLFLEDELGA